MGLFDHFPYTNFHELNLDWLLQMVKELENTVNNFVALNTIKYADPIQWNIITQYEANTVVVDPQTGTAYISTKAVPSGVALSNTDYWSVIFTLDVLSANKNLTLRDDGSNVLSTFASAAGDWLLWNGTLYRVSQAINVNEAYVVGYNLTRYTVEMFISDYITELKTEIGDLTDLNTTDKDNLVEAINEVLQTLTSTTGDLTNLNTTDKDNLVEAINEVLQTLTSTTGDLADLNTIDKDNLVEAINDVVEDVYYINVKDFGAAGDGLTDDTQAIQDAVDSATDKAVILFPVGTYAIDGTVNINKSGLILMGVGRQSVITRNSASSNALFYVHGSSRLNGFEAHHLSFDTIANGFCFEIAYTFDNYIHHCSVKAIKGFIQYGNSSENNMNIWSRVTDIIGNINQNHAQFIYIYGNSNGINVENCQINNELSYSGGHFIECHPHSGIDTLVIRNNLVQRINYGIVINNTDANGVIQNIFMSDNIFDTIGYNAIYVESNIANTICRIMSNHNWFSTPQLTLDSIPVVYTANTGRIVQIHHENDYFIDLPSRAIFFQGASNNGISNVKINDCTFNGFQRINDLTAAYACITIAQTAGRQYTISDNMFSPSADISANNAFGIFIASGIGFVAVNGNMMYGVTTPVTGSPTVASGNVPTSINT